MRREASYIASDFDRRAHRTRLHLDLENMDLEDGSIDLMISAHVLEHVRDTDAALGEIYRVLSVSGDLLLQVPLHQVITSAPRQPEFHADRTPVFWRFGLDLTQRLERNGFATKMLVTSDLYRRIAQADSSWDHVDPDVDTVGLVQQAVLGDAEALGDDAIARVSWFEPSYMFAVWHAHKVR